MMRNWMIAGVCAIATAWGIAGCSSNNASAPAAQGEPKDTAPIEPVEPDGPDGPMDPEPDDKTPEEETSTQWSAGESLVRLPVPAALPEVRAVRRIRTNEAGDANSPDLLDDNSFPAVPYEPGKILISEGEASSDNTLRMRGHFVERINNLTRRLSIIPAPGTIVSALKITETGLVMEMGGRQAEGMDFRRVVDIARNQGGPSAVGAGVDDRGWDLTLTFGEPTRSPEGNGEAYWSARLMPDPGQIADGADADTRRLLLVDGQPNRIGTYKLWLSNHAGVETNLEPVEGSSSYPGESYPEDDVNSYLKYAAYGMMTFASSDQFERSTGNSGTGWRSIRDRAHGFHLGYDAFEDKSSKRTTDIGEAISGGTFTGLTIALELDRISRGNLNSRTSIDLRLAKRLRGDVELTATISRTASDNSIKGRIRNLEVWDSRGYWKDYATIADDIELGSGSIGADGQYSGTVEQVPGFATIDPDDPGGGGSGEYHGSFYGPVSGLETAGVWYLHGSQGGIEKALLGSFGAKHAPPSE